VKSQSVLLFDIGNTRTHVARANARRITAAASFPTAAWFGGAAPARVLKRFARAPLAGAAVCSVVPRATPLARRFVEECCHVQVLELTPATVRGVGVAYPRPETIGPDRLANVVAARRHYGAPAVVVDFGTAVTFDVLDARGNYVGGIIAPGLAAMTDYLHEKTALLPRIKIRETTAVIGKSTKEAMMIGAVHGYRGLVRQLVQELKRELQAPSLPVIATGGCAKLIAAKLPEITAVAPNLTLEGLRLVWQEQNAR
jgi:type III pantothenate kinase